jgi:hypothetical protein
MTTPDGSVGRASISWYGTYFVARYVYGAFDLKLCLPARRHMRRADVLAATSACLGLGRVEFKSVIRNRISVRPMNASKDGAKSWERLSSLKNPGPARSEPV